MLVQEEEDTGGGTCDSGGRGVEGGVGCDYCSVPTAKKNDVHVIVSCLLQ